jgi:hypothetical protein
VETQSHQKRLKPTDRDGRTHPLLVARCARTSPMTITAPHFVVLAFMEADPRIQPDEIATRLGAPVLDVEAQCRELAAAGLLAD